MRPRVSQSRGARMEPTIYKPSIYKGAGIYKTVDAGGGGGGVPVPDGYKELMWITSDFLTNGNDASYIDLGKGYNTYKYVMPFVDCSDFFNYLISNNKTADYYCLPSMANGRIKNAIIQQTAGIIKLEMQQEGVSGSGYIDLTPMPTITNVINDKDYIKIGEFVKTRGEGNISVGTGSFLRPFDLGECCFKIGTIKVYDEQDNLFQDWRPVEKLNGGNNRFGYLNVLNNVFKSSERPGRYILPGPEII